MDLLVFSEMVPKCTRVYSMGMNLLQLVCHSTVCVYESPTWMRLVVVHSPSWRSCLSTTVHECTTRHVSILLRLDISLFLFNHCKQEAMSILTCISLSSWGKLSPMSTRGRRMAGLGGTDILTLTHKLLSKSVTMEACVPLQHLCLHCAVWYVVGTQWRTMPAKEQDNVPVYILKLVMLSLHPKSKSKRLDYFPPKPLSTIILLLTCTFNILVPVSQCSP